MEKLAKAKEKNKMEEKQTALKMEIIPQDRVKCRNIGKNGRKKFDREICLMEELAMRVIFKNIITMRYDGNGYLYHINYMNLYIKDTI